MKIDRQPVQRLDERGTSSVGVLLGRLMWFIVGPLILAATTYAIVNRGSGWLTALDATYFVVVALMVWGRWVEQRSGSAITADGKPATWDHFRRYVRVLVPLAVVIWVAANVLGKHVLNRAD